MASADLEAKAKEAFIDDHFELAVDLYSQAIALSPNSADLFVDRAQANIKLRNFTGEFSILMLEGAYCFFFSIEVLLCSGVILSLGEWMLVVEDERLLLLFAALVIFVPVIWMVSAHAMNWIFDPN